MCPVSTNHNIHFANYFTNDISELVNSLLLFGCYCFASLAISRCLSTTPHPISRAGGSILLVLYFMIILMACQFIIFMAVVRYDPNPI